LSALILDTSSKIICPHGGLVSPIPSNTRVFINGQPAVIQSDTFLIAGCLFNVSSVPRPCISSKWLSASLRIKINGQPVILNNSVGICLSADQSPQGPTNIIVTQLRVKGA
jgi:hypothetical protein